MSGMSLVKTRIIGGVWEGVLTSKKARKDTPEITVSHLDGELNGVELTRLPDTKQDWFLSVPIPPEALADGVQTFLIRDKATDEILNSFSIVTGELLEDDIRAEIGLLREELDMLKRAFRRHCLETQG